MAGDAALAAQHYQQAHLVSLPGLLDAAFLDLLDRAAQSSTFVRETVSGLGEREIEEPLRMTSALLLGLRSARLVEWVRAVTGNPAITTARGNVVRSWPGGADRLDWHDDSDMAGRIAAITILLGDTDFVGGEFELRRKGSVEASSFRHARRGDGLLVKVHPGLEHRVLPLSAGGPRCVFAGWFMTGD